jgi:hypothetical protein
VVIFSTSLLGASLSYGPSNGFRPSQDDIRGGGLRVLLPDFYRVVVFSTALLVLRFVRSFERLSPFSG